MWQYFWVSRARSSERQVSLVGTRSAWSSIRPDRRRRRLTPLNVFSKLRSERPKHLAGWEKQCSLRKVTSQGTHSSLTPRRCKRLTPLAVRVRLLSTIQAAHRTFALDTLRAATDWSGQVSETTIRSAKFRGDPLAAAVGGAPAPDGGPLGLDVERTSMTRGGWLWPDTG
jgi:hypothetical protein